jgi:Zn-dependent protease with chaperone function
MNIELKARFYSGIKPQAIEADVLLEAGQIQISYLKNGESEKRYWELDKIKPDQDANDQKFILQYGAVHPYEYLEFEDPQAYLVFEQFYKHRKWRKTGNIFTRNPLAAVSMIVGLFIMIGVAAYFILVPNISDMLSKTVPVSWETELGQKMANSMIDESKEDKLKSRMLDTFFRIMDIKSQYKIKFHYINDSIVNAFAMPGGNIVIYKGLFDKITSYESLAGLIGHEFTHVEFKHSLKTIFRSLSSYIMLAAFFGDLTGLAGIIVENANTIQNLSYSRAFESEADANAVRILLDRKIGLTGMLDLFNIFLTEGKQGMAVPKFLNTHPVTEDRIKFIKMKMGKEERELFHYADLLDIFNRMKHMETEGIN